MELHGIKYIGLEPVKIAENKEYTFYLRKRWLHKGYQLLTTFVKEYNLQNIYSLHVTIGSLEQAESYLKNSYGIIVKL